MKKWFVLLAFSTNVFAGLDGNWEGFCDNLPKNLPNATYNYRFNNGQMESFLQFYRDQNCGPQFKSNAVPQARGSYQIESSQILGGQEIYEVMMNDGQRSQRYRATIENNVLKLCSLNPYSCWSYTRR